MATEIKFDTPCVRCADGRVIEVVDQRQLPGKTEWLCAKDVPTLARLIKTLKVRGDPAIDLAAAACLVLRADALEDAGGDAHEADPAAREAALRADAESLRSARPTKENALAWVDSVAAAARLGAAAMRGAFFEGLSGGPGARARGVKDAGYVKPDVDAELRYAGCLLLGIGGMEPDAAAGVAVLEDLIVLGSTRAMAYLAMTLEDGAPPAVPRDEARAVGLFEAAAAKDDPVALPQLARILADGRCKGGFAVEKDDARAAKLSEAGARLGDPISKHLWGTYLDSGVGVPSGADPDAAFALFRENGDQFPESRLHVAAHLISWRGSLRDRARASAEEALKARASGGDVTKGKDGKKKLPQFGPAAATRELQLACVDQAPVALYAFSRWLASRQDPVACDESKAPLIGRIEGLKIEAGEAGQEGFEALPEHIRRAIDGTWKK